MPDTSPTTSKKATRLPPGVRHPVDVHVGARLRLRRTLLGLNQTAVANAVGLTFQQVQKYENGDNRVSASRLYEFAGHLGVPVGFFFDDMPPELATHAGRLAAGLAAQRARDAGAAPETDPARDPLASREALELVRGYLSVNADLRRRIRQLVALIAGDADAAPEPPAGPLQAAE